MELLVIAIFIVGYVAIAFEHAIKLNKAASALIAGVLCWVVYMIYTKCIYTTVQNLSKKT